MERPYNQGDDFCPAYHHAVELIGRRWTGVILRQLMLGSSRFAEVRDAIPSLTDRMLANRLRELESEKIVTRTVLDTTPVQVQYALTKKGRDLERTITALSEWADHWESEREITGAPTARS